MYQVPSQTNKTQYLTLIDKCTQILREDRIWLRNMLKGNNEEVYYLFKGLPKNIDMKQLQIKLRKYIMRAKQQQKQEQLQRFKENMHLPEFIEVAQEKRHEPQHNKSQAKLRGTLKQFQANNEPKSSFLAKWNNYTHYNPSINLNENRSQTANIQSQIKSLNKQWTNNYKPHSFNKSLNGELANKLSAKNSSMSRMNNRHNKSSTSLTKEKSSIVNSRFHNNQEVDELNHSSKYPFGGARNSSKSLKQLESKIYEELRQFQQNSKIKKDQELSNNRSFSQHLAEKPQQKHTYIEPQPKASSMSKENIDQLLKLKLGNCDYEVYRKSQQTQHDEDPAEYVFQEKTTSQKKLYDQGYFPPIEEQTERDSESQRYPEEPLKFGMNMSSKQDSEDRHKITFASFAKASPSQSFNKNYEINDAKMITSTNQIHEFTQQPLIQQQVTFMAKPQSFIDNSASLKINYQEHVPVNRISESVYASAQKKSDINENYIESDLHKSIMESIQRNRDVFQQVGFENSQKIEKNEKYGEVENVSCFNFQADKSINLPLPKPVSDISSFQSSLFSSTHDDQGLFTSPHLLNECMKFLKQSHKINFENSGLKEMSGSVLQSKFDSPVNSQQKSFQQTFNNLASTGTINFPQPITITESITKDFYNPGSEARINSLFESKQSSVCKGQTIEFQTYSKPQYIGGGDSFKKSEIMESSMNKSEQKSEGYGPQSIRKDEVSIYNHSRKASSMKKHSQIEDTIAFPQQNQPNHFNMSNTSKHSNHDNQTSINVENFKTSQFPNIVMKTGNSAQKRQFMTLENQPIYRLIELEDIIDKIIEANEGNIEVDSTWLKHTINNKLIFDQEVGAALTQILISYINSPDATYNFIELITCVEQEYKKNPTYQPRKSPSRDMCSLLDIEEKGFITFDDVQNFVTQLQNAGFDHIEAIAQHLQEVFDIADLMNLKQISYVNLYIIKNQDCFENLWNYLQEFEFEIAADQEE